ncbi:MAG: DUF4276 family protein [Acidobacteria bacterium]|nr:DUF4276 family protein [Acidobacteriota bacterium]
MVVTLFVEGGAPPDQNGRSQGRAFNRLCARAVKTLLGKVSKRHIDVVPCGPNRNAIEQFRSALEGQQYELPVLLVDSEGPVRTNPLAHIAQLNSIVPGLLNEDQVHLMVQLMEAWLLSDPDALHLYFGRGFRKREVPSVELEEIPKASIESALAEASASCDSPYIAGQHGRRAFEILATVDPQKLQAACPSAKRFFDYLRNL